MQFALRTTCQFITCNLLLVELNLNIIPVLTICLTMWHFQGAFYMMGLKMSLLSLLPRVQKAAAEMSDIESPGTARAELPRQFSFLSTLALGYSITNSWAGYAGILSIPLVMGGGPTAFSGLCVASIACCFISKHVLHHSSR